MNLNRAWLCGNCEEVGENANFCTACGSNSLVHLGKLLNKELAEPSVEELIESAYRKGRK